MTLSFITNNIGAILICAVLVVLVFKFLKGCIKSIITVALIILLILWLNQYGFIAYILNSI